MKIALFVVAFSLFFSLTMAQYTRGEQNNDSTIIHKARAFKKKDFLLTIGFGYPGSYSNTKLVFYTKAEYAIHNFVGLGINYGYESLQYPSNAIVGIGTFLLRGNIHPLTTKKFDLYIGGGIGFHWISYPSILNEQNVLVPALDCTFGGRYFFTKRLALYSEIGFTKTIMQSGLTYKF